MSAREKIRRADINKSTANKKIEKADFRKSENRAFEKAKNCIIKMTEKTEKQNINKSVKNKFFIRKTETVSKEELIIFLENINFFLCFFSQNQEIQKK